jgi:glycosyltransferase involved in cell wall biosynthesis
MPPAARLSPPQAIPQPAPAALRILLVVATFYPDSYGGAERQALILAGALARRGVEVRIVTPTVRRDLPVSESTEFGSIERVRLSHFPNLGGRRIGATLAWGRALLRRFGQPGRVDAIYVFHARLHALGPLRLARRLGVPLMIKLGGGGEASDFEALRRKRFLYGRMARQALVRHTDGFVANSVQIVEDLQKLGASEDRIFAFPNGVSVPPAAAARAAGRERNGKRFVFAGRMVTDKSVAVLFDAARRLLAQGRDLELTFLGDGPERDRLAAEAERLGLSRHFAFPGVVSDVYPPLFRADFFVSASEREGQSNALLEAMSAGCVPIVFGASGAADLIDHCVTGFLASRSDAATFAQVMAAALDLRPEQRLAMASAARRTIEDTVGIDAIAGRTVETLRTLIDRRGGR